MTGHVVRMKHLSHGFKHWRARCSCGWRELCDSDREMREAAETHAFDHKGSIELDGAA